MIEKQFIYNGHQILITKTTCNFGIYVDGICFGTHIYLPTAIDKAKAICDNYNGE